MNRQPPQKGWRFLSAAVFLSAFSFWLCLSAHGHPRRDAMPVADGLHFAAFPPQADCSPFAAGLRLPPLTVVRSYVHVGTAAPGCAL